MQINNFPVTFMSQCINKFLNQYYSECYRSRVTNIPPAAAPVNAIVADDEDPYAGDTQSYDVPGDNYQGIDEDLEAQPEEGGSENSGGDRGQDGSDDNAGNDNSQAPFFRSNRQPTPVPGGVAGAAGGRGQGRGRGRGRGRGAKKEEIGQEILNYLKATEDDIPELNDLEHMF